LVSIIGHVDTSAVTEGGEVVCFLETALTSSSPN
jgi:hypothetical protein